MAATVRSQSVERIATVRSDDLMDETTGIRQFRSIYTQLETEMQPRVDELRKIQQQLQKVQDEIVATQKDCGGIIDCGRSTSDRLDKLVASGQALQKEFEIKQREAQNAYMTRLKALTSPLNAQIATELVKFAQIHGYSDIRFDLRNDEGCVVLDPIDDVTRAFIDYYNATVLATPERKLADRK